MASNDDLIDYEEEELTPHAGVTTVIGAGGTVNGDKKKAKRKDRM